MGVTVRSWNRVSIAITTSLLVYLTRLILWPSSSVLDSVEMDDRRTSGVRQTDLRECQHIRPVVGTCPRFLAFTINADAGLGHKVSEVLFSWRMAKALNATLAFDFKEFSQSSHHPYDWAVSYLGLDEGEVLSVVAAQQLYEVKVVPLCPYTSPPPIPLCNVLYQVPHHFCCQGDCFRSMRGLFEEEKACLRAKHLRARSRIPLGQSAAKLSADHVSIVWHLRVGDYRIHENDAAFFTSVWSIVLQALTPLPLHNYFVGEHSDAIGAHFPFLSSFPNATVLAPPLVASFRIFQEADVLVGSGSSFPQVAALVSTSLVFLNHEPKHLYGGVEHVSEFPFLWKNGTLSISALELRARVLKTICRKRSAMALCFGEH